MRTPPGVESSVYALALERFAGIVGQENVYTSDADLDLYRDAYSILWQEPQERIAAGAIAPKSVEQVQALVRVANQFRIPLYPISTGRNLGYGGSAPNYSGSVVLDLKRMNRIIEINEELHYCIVEPGVSFFDLYAEFRRRNLRLQASQPAPGWGSPIGNALDHGVGSPAGDNFRNACGLEVVLGTGDLLRTGMGALPGADTWATYRNGIGPSLDGIFSQSNFGIVTKMGFNLFPWPDSMRRLTVATRQYDDLDAIVKACNELFSAGVCRSVYGMQSPLARAQSPEFVQLTTQRGGGTAAQFNQLASDQDKDVFQTELVFAGPETVTQAQIEFAHDKLATIGGVRLYGREAPPVLAPADIDALSDAQALAFGKPGLTNFWRDTAQYGWDGHLWFSPLLPRTGAELRKAQQVLGDACRALDFYWGWPDTLWFSGGFTIVKNFSVSKDDHAQNKKTREVVTHLIRIAADHGWSEYRTAPAFQQAVADVLSFNGHALLRFNERIKDAIDPNGILSPGRYGIWPRHLRSTDH